MTKGFTRKHYIIFFNIFSKESLSLQLYKYVIDKLHTQYTDKDIKMLKELHSNLFVLK